MVYLASAYESAGNFVRQAEVLETLLKEFPGERKNQLCSLAAAYRRAGQIDKAIDLLGQGSREFQDRADYPSALAEIHAQAGRIDEALALFKAMVQTSRAAERGDWAVAADNTALRIASAMPRTVPQAQGVTVMRAMRAEMRNKMCIENIDRHIAQAEAAAMPVAAAPAPGASPAPVTDRQVLLLLEADAELSPNNTATLLKLASAYEQRKDAAKLAGVMRRIVKLVSVEANHVRLIRALTEMGADAEAVAAYEAFFAEFPQETAKHLAAYADAVVRANTMQYALQRWKGAAGHPPDARAASVVKALEQARDAASRADAPPSTP
ncbi:MAG: hypothetical protein IT440_09855 [Phycisphaeraceae bacterium]|nr:hypothetical protein [Phycisphaeraceae bacterium]